MNGLRSRLLWAAALALAAAGTAFAATAFKVKVTAEVANVRLKPSIGSVIIRQIPQGEILEATRKEGQWYLVAVPPDESGQTSGYVHESLVMPLEDIPRTEAGPPAAKKPPSKPVEKPPVKEPEPRPKAEPMAPADVPRTAAGERGRVYFSLFGGAGYALIGDLNKGAQGLADLYSAQLGVAASDDLTPLRAGLLFGGEIGLPLSRNVHLIIGGERSARASESEVSFPRADGGADLFLSRPEFSVFPVKAAIEVHPVDVLFFRLGLAYHFASCAYHYRFERGPDWQEWSGEAKARGIGFHGGVGLEWPLGENFALVGEVSGRYAPISGFEGTGTFQNQSLSIPATEEGKLYAYEAKLGLTAYSLLYIRDKLPTEAGVENAREAKVDFSGLALRLGFKITF